MRKPKLTRVYRAHKAIPKTSNQFFFTGGIIWHNFTLINWQYTERKAQTCVCLHSHWNLQPHQELLVDNCQNKTETGRTEQCLAVHI